MNTLSPRFALCVCVFVCACVCVCVYEAVVTQNIIMNRELCPRYFILNAVPATNNNKMNCIRLKQSENYSLSSHNCIYSITYTDVRAYIHKCRLRTTTAAAVTPARNRFVFFSYTFICYKSFRYDI